MIWAAERMVPSILYLLFELHPARMMPITSNETMASKKNSADEMLAPVHCGASGITAKPANNDGGYLEKFPVSICGNNIFFLDKLNQVGNGLEDTIIPNLHRPKPVLNESGDLTLCIDRHNSIKENEWQYEQ